MIYTIEEEGDERSCDHEVTKGEIREKLEGAKEKEGERKKGRKK